MAAAQAGDEATAELLLAHGADAGLADDAGRTAADHARAAGHDTLAVRVAASGPAA
jgi:ankyrin repeat protein